MREIIIGLAAVSGLGTAGYMSGAFEGGEYYEMAPADVSAKLSRLTLPDGMEDATGNVVLRTAAAGPSQVKWDIVANGYSIAEIDAFLKPSGSGTRVTVAFAMLDGPERDQLATLVPMDDAFLGELIEMALTEQIDATLEGRPFDQKKLAMKMTGYIAANPAAVANFQNSVQSNIEGQLDDIDIDSGDDAGLDDGGPFEEPAYDSGSFDEGGDDWGN